MCIYKDFETKYSLDIKKIKATFHLLLETQI